MLVAESLAPVQLVVVPCVPPVLWLLPVLPFVPLLALPFLVRIRVTLTFSITFAPRERAPWASACVTSMGFTWPSFGRNTPPLTFSML